MKKDQEPQPIEISERELDQLVREIEESALAPKSKEILIRILLSFLWLQSQIERKTLTVRKLLRMFFGPKTEKSRKGPKDPEPPAAPSPKGEAPKPKGHGKNGAAEFSAAEHVSVPHPKLKPQECCPSCRAGSLYPYGNGSVLRIFGQAPLIAKIFEPAQLRCGSCQDLFTAPLPKEAGGSRHHETANAMVACLNYQAGMPFYRLEALQRSLKVPLPDATQFDMVEKVADCGAPVVEHLKKLASNCESQGFDDTGMKVLSLIAENKASCAGERTGMQTTAILAKADGQEIALFQTGRKHAGENIADLLKNRDPLLAKVTQMSDAAPCNFSHDFMRLVNQALCLDHGRRNFHELLEQFPADCRHVIEELARVYKNDSETKTQGLSDSERLAYHQAHSLPIMNGLNAWMEEKMENRDVEPNGPLGKAIKYFLAHWNGLTAFLRIPGAPLSNAHVERLVKRCVLRRKASLFYKTLAGAAIGDVLMSLIETTRLAAKNPFEYLVALQKYAALVRANPERWLPWNYQQALPAI
jgi:hypothetical protein